MRRPHRAGLLVVIACLIAASAGVVASLGYHRASSSAAAEGSGVHQPLTTSTTGAGDLPLQWTTSKVTMTYDGLVRYYLVTRPSRPAGGALPVVLALHGRDVTPSTEEGRMNFASVAGPAVLVYPAGYDESWNAGACCGGAFSAKVDDVGFLTAVVHAVLVGLPAASAQHVYLAGYSNGGKMALRLACADPGLFRAVAVYGATAVASCPSTPPSSLLELASAGDPELTIGPGGTPQQTNGYIEPTVTAQVAQYRTSDKCPASGASTLRGALATTTWNCSAGRHVSMAVYSGGSHAWPAGSSSTPSGQQVMWEFFVEAGAGR